MARGRRAPSANRAIPVAPASADFHAHTARSDGLLAPATLVRAAVTAGVTTLAITDHDTLAGVRELMAAPAGAPDGIPGGLTLIPGVEINTVGRGRGLPDGELHVVGLGVDPADDALEAVLARQRGSRRLRFSKMTTKLRETGYPIDAYLEDVDLARDDALGRPTLARALVAARFAVDVQDAFVRLVGYGGPGYVPREGIGPLEAISAIRAAGGLAVLAHFGVADQQEALLRELIGAGLNGIETHHRSFDAPTIRSVATVAARLQLVPSGGTDFHGDECTYAEAIAETVIPAALVEGVLAAVSRPGPAAEGPG